MKVRDTNHFRRLLSFVSATSPQLCQELVSDFVVDFPVHCNGLNSIRATQTSQHIRFVSATFTKTSWFHDLSPFVSATFMICVHDFPHREVSVKVGVMEFGL